MKIQTIADVDRYEPGSGDAVDQEAVQYLYERAPYESDGEKNLVGHLYVDRSLLPSDGRSVGTQYEITVVLDESPPTEGLPESGATSSIVPLEADYEGANDGSPEFTLRNTAAETDGQRRGYLYLFPELFVTSVSLDFLDLTHDINEGFGSPDESYGVTFEFDVSPGVLDSPPEKREE